jgi:lactoylglutathione lyase
MADRQRRVVFTAEDYALAVAFYRDALGLPEEAAYASPDGRVTILEAGRATLEIADPAQAEFIDRVEVGRRVAGHIRLAFEVTDAPWVTARLAERGATVVTEPVRTPWDSLNARLDGPAGLQLTLFRELAASSSRSSRSRARRNAAGWRSARNRQHLAVTTTMMPRRAQ